MTLNAQLLFGVQRHPNEPSIAASHPPIAEYIFRVIIPLSKPHRALGGIVEGKFHQ